MFQRSRIKVVAGTALLVAVAVALLFYSASDTSHSTLQLHLRLLGSSVYEYHARTGIWPAKTDDLAQTSLPQTSPYWKWELDNEVFVIVWPKDLKPEPKDNADAILAYHNKGLLANLGRVWVCLGDLRTEYIKTEELGAKLQAAGK